MIWRVECRAVAQQLGCTRAVRVVHSVDVATPCLAGLVRPVLVLPCRQSQGQDDLRAILAHELAHARHHDLAWNLAAHLASILLWFHPLAWRIRAAHASACDAVSDAVAADYVGDVGSYGRTLARLAVEASSTTPAHVLAMARTSDVRRRLDALNRRVFGTSLCWRRVGPALVVVGLLSAVIGGFGFTRAEQAAESRSPANAREADAPRRRRGDRSADRGRFHRVSRPLRREGPEGDGRHRQGRTGDDRVSARRPHRILRDHRPQGRVRAALLRLGRREAPGGHAAIERPALRAGHDHRRDRPG